MTGTRAQRKRADRPRRYRHADASRRANASNAVGARPRIRAKSGLRCPASPTCAVVYKATITPT